MSTEETTGAPSVPVKKAAKANNIITDVESAVKSVGTFIGKEAGVLAGVFKKQSPQVQADLKTVSGIVQIIKTDIAETPDVLVYAIKKAYPDFDLTTLNNYLASAAKDLQIAQDVIEPTLQGTIAAIQAHIPTLTTTGAKSTFWTGLANLLGQLVAPNTPWGYVVTLLVYVYNNFVKPKIS